MKYYYILAALVTVFALTSCEKEEPSAIEEPVREKTIAEQFDERLLSLEKDDIKLKILYDGCLCLYADGIGVSILPEEMESRYCFPLYMDDAEIGYLTLERFHNPDYSRTTSFVVHFNDTPVSLSYLDSITLFDCLLKLIKWD